MTPPSCQAAVDLYWIPLGAGGHSVAFNGRVFEAFTAARRHRDRCDIYHAALVVEVDGDRYAIELAPSPDDDGARRGVAALRVFPDRSCGPLAPRRVGRADGAGSREGEYATRPHTTRSKEES